MKPTYRFCSSLRQRLGALGSRQRHISRQRKTVHQRTSSASRRGSVLVETALCMTLVLLPLSIGILQYGIVIQTTHQLEQIAREGARFASVHGSETTFDSADTQTSPPSLRNYIKTLCASKTYISYNDIKNSITITPAAMSNRAAGLPITVGITYPMKNKIFVGKIVPATTIIDDNYATSSTFVLE